MQEPIINVGITGAPEVEFRISNVSEPFRARYINGKIDINGRLYNEMRLNPADTGREWFELDNVTIGVNFHWQRHECQRFAGSLHLIPDDSCKNVIAVNEIGIEEYLKSVISSEMSANASPALLRAHAVVSRSWLLRQLHDRGKHTAAEAGGWKRSIVSGESIEELVKWYDREDHTLFDVCADDHCQRYQGITRQTSASVNEAVESTRGLVLTHNGEVCDARFSKCCGGFTETFENCWEDTPRPYLTSIADSDASGRCFCNTADTDILDSVLNNYDRETIDFFSWETTYTAEELSETVKERSGIDFGLITELRPLERGASGRITRLLIRGTRRSAIVGKELEIRRWLSKSHLRSSAFTVERDGNQNFILKGNGWGHGVGLCQIGAAVMGAEGYDWHDILKHYFPNALLTKLYE